MRSPILHFKQKALGNSYLKEVPVDLPVLQAFSLRRVVQEFTGINITIALSDSIQQDFELEQIGDIKSYIDGNDGRVIFWADQKGGTPFTSVNYAKSPKISLDTEGRLKLHTWHYSSTMKSNAIMKGNCISMVYKFLAGNGNMRAITGDTGGDYLFYGNKLYSVNVVSPNNEGAEIYINNGTTPVAHAIHYYGNAKTLHVSTAINVDPPLPQLNFNAYAYLYTYTYMHIYEIVTYDIENKNEIVNNQVDNYV